MVVLSMRRAKYLLVSAFDVASVAVMVGGAWLALAEPAAAYVDPSVMTYTIQALAGVAVALSAVLGVVWRRARRWLLRALHIDENAGKVVEGDVSLVSGDEVQRRGQLSKADDAARDERSRQGVEQPQHLPWGARLALALLASVTLSFMTIVSAPLEIVATNASGLSFSPANVWASLAVAAVVVALVVALVVSALKGRAFDVALAVLVALALAELVQALFLNAGLPAADGQPVAWDDYTKITLGSAAAWLAIIVVSVLLAIKKPSASKGVSVVVSLLLVLTSAVSLGTTVAAHAHDGGELAVTEDGLMDVSDKSNVIVFVLDTFDTSHLNEVLASDPDALSEMGGFTYFTNSMASMIPTRYAIPYLVTGHMFDPFESEFTRPQIHSWFEESNLIDTAVSQGYSVGIYADPITEGMDKLSGQTVNVHKLENLATDPVDTVKVLVKCALYRNLPWGLKSSFRFYTDDLNREVVSKTISTPSSTPYVIDDPSYYKKLTGTKLSIDDSGATGSYRFIHLNGSHSPYVMNENAEAVPEGESSLAQQNVGSIKIVSEYIRQLKDLGVYDQSTIVITADHGNWWSAENTPDATSPILLVKPAGADSSKPAQASDVPTGHLDLAATLTESFGAQSDDPTVFEVGEGPRTRYFYWTDHSEMDKMDHWIREWAVNGNALDFSTWGYTGRFWPANTGY